MRLLNQRPPPRTTVRSRLSRASNAVRLQRMLWASRISFVRRPGCPWWAARSQRTVHASSRKLLTAVTVTAVCSARQRLAAGSRVPRIANELDAGRRRINVNGRTEISLDLDKRDFSVLSRRDRRAGNPLRREWRRFGTLPILGSPERIRAHARKAAASKSGESAGRTCHHSVASAHIGYWRNAIRLRNWSVSQPRTLIVYPPSTVSLAPLM
jgi:hypothetical protein